MSDTIFAVILMALALAMSYCAYRVGLARGHVDEIQRHLADYDRLIKQIEDAG
jgi:hypothetical protein